eukprot:NODE_13827_length_1144_cov_5.941003.p1 GENE.NODE_13827_length_1144_cov_5.941003~~NODE_13827_length_1144_cov_5.941003.p1  ORF type:complete len:257 (+),score=77.48 NODE_13827_length_1144_cov_5.941003:81-773(+)
MDGPLLPGWEQQWSDDHHCRYFWHKATRQSSWERPAVPTETAVKSGVANRPLMDKLWDGEGAEEGAAHMATPMTPMVSSSGKSMTPLTPGSSVGAVAAGAVQNSSAGFRAAQAAGIFRGRGLTETPAPQKLPRPQSAPGPRQPAVLIGQKPGATPRPAAAAQQQRPGMPGKAPVAATKPGTPAKPATMYAPRAPMPAAGTPALRQQQVLQAQKRPAPQVQSYSVAKRQRA